MANYLLQNGANIDVKNYANRTFLHIAAREGKIEIVKFLVENGAVVDEKDIAGGTPFRLATSRYHFDVASLLLESGANIDTKTAEGQTILHTAARQGMLNVLKFLVEKGAKIDARDNNDQTPIFIAYKYDQKSIIDYLTATKKRKAETEIPEEIYNNKDPCVVCYEPRNGLFVLMPCGHTSLCEFCCLRISTSTDHSKCPSCRKAITSFKKIFYEKPQ